MHKEGNTTLNFKIQSKWEITFKIWHFQKRMATAKYLYVVF